MTNKMTKKEVINQLLAEEVIQANSLYAEFLAHELELLEKKAGSKKATKTQKENEILKEVVVGALAELGKPSTVTEIQKANEELGALSNQKISALLKQLAEEGLVQKGTENKKSVFSVEVAEEVAEEVEEVEE